MKNIKIDFIKYIYILNITTKIKGVVMKITLLMLLSLVFLISCDNNKGSEIKANDTNLTQIEGITHYREGYKLQIFHFTNRKMNKECLIFIHPGVEKMDKLCQDIKKD